MLKTTERAGHPYFMVAVSITTHQWDLFQPDGRYVRLLAQHGQGGRLICTN